MKIGIDARLYRSSAAGIGRYSQNLIKNILTIDSNNQYVLLMTPEDAVEFKKQQNFSNVKILETPIAHYSLAEQTSLPRLIKKEKCDLWDFLNFNFPVFYKGKFISTIHDLTLFYYPGRNKNSFIYKFAYKYLFKKACQNSTRIIAVSESTKKDILNTFTINKNKIEVIYEAADDKTFGNADVNVLKRVKEKYITENVPILLYVGQWRPHKNLPRLISAFDKIRASRKIKLVIAGKPDETFPEIQESIDKSPYLSDIIIPGFVTDEELAAWYELATVFVFPSLYEGFGLPGLEAMKAGLPVVSSNKTSLPEIYQDAALYFNPEDVDDIKDKLIKVLDNTSLRQSLVDKGFSVVKKYSWRQTAIQTLKLYKEILNNH